MFASLARAHSQMAAILNHKLENVGPTISNFTMRRKVAQTVTLLLFKAQFHEAEFFDRNEIFFCLTSTQMELIFYLLNLNNRNFGSIEKFRLVENRL